ncbi:MAG: magnesium/cobalt transporter CorA [Bacteroidota bacterium]
MVTILQYTNSEVKKLTVKEFAQTFQQPEGIFWIDLENPQEAEEETILLSLLDYHPLAIEDCQRGKGEEGHLPKVEDFGEYLFIIFNPIERLVDEQDLAQAKVEIRTTQLSAFLSKRMLVTHHYKPLRSISYAGQLCGKNAQSLGRGPDFLFHLIIDDLVDQYSPILDALDDATDAMENEVFKKPSQRTMIRILQLKRNIMTVRRIATYQKEMLNRLSRGEFSSLITYEEMAYYRNVYDHLVRMSDLTDSYRDIVSSLLDAYLSVTSNNLNQVMKVLTIISTIFLPLSFITGFFGMNFEFLPGLKWEYGVLAATLFMLAVGVGMLWVFRRNKWL